jgi:teichuronic acid biosynthesis glycosyltransferase TuaG
MINNPLVSIVTPVYNSAPYLAAMIQSVVLQTYTNWEHILVDDGSKDNSVEIIKNLAATEPRIKLLHLPGNQGSGPARNIAIEAAKGKYIAFLDSDDIWHPEKLEKHVTFMQIHDAAFSHTSYGFIDEDGRIIRQTFHVSKEPVTFRMALQRTEISCLTAMYDVEKVGKMYMPDIRRKQDYALWLNILRKGFKSIPLDVELAWYRQRRGSATSNKFSLIHKHYIFLRKVMKLKRIYAFKYTALWIKNGLRKYYL